MSNLLWVIWLALVAWALTGIAGGIWSVIVDWAPESLLLHRTMPDGFAEYDVTERSRFNKTRVVRYSRQHSALDTRWFREPGHRYESYDSHLESLRAYAEACEKADDETIKKGA